MAILSVDDLLLHFTAQKIWQLADDGEGVDTAILTELITSAESRVKTSLAKLYTTTQIEASDECKRLTAVITLYYLEGRRAQGISETTAALYADTLRILQALQDGEIKLPDTTEVLPRITPSSAIDIFEDSGLFDGLRDPHEESKED
jgi:phage gp36-like protein